MFRIPILDVYVTGACNLECQYCFGEVDTRPGMHEETFVQTLRFARFIGSTALALCGGEPLLYRHLVWAVDKARSHGFQLVLRTNGHFIPRWRSFIAENFEAVGISLDGDEEANNRMRPLKSRYKMDPPTNCEALLQELSALNALNRNLYLILASVATAENYVGILELSRLLVQRRPPLNLWKIYQFVGNNFRASDNQSRFTLASEEFSRLQRRVEIMVADEFPVIYRKSNEVDGSCLVANRDGDVLLGATKFGNVVSDPFADIWARLTATGATMAVFKNKSLTYPTLVAMETR